MKGSHVPSRFWSAKVNSSVKIFLIIFLPCASLFVAGFFAAFYVGAWLGTLVFMAGMALMCLSGFWVRPLMERLGWW